MWEAGPEDHVDLMSDSLPRKAETEHRRSETEKNSVQRVGHRTGAVWRQQNASYKRNSNEGTPTQVARRMPALESLPRSTVGLRPGDPTSSDT